MDCCYHNCRYEGNHMISLAICHFKIYKFWNVRQVMRNVVTYVILYSNLITLFRNELCANNLMLFSSLLDIPVTSKYPKYCFSLLFLIFRQTTADQIFYFF